MSCKFVTIIQKDASTKNSVDLGYVTRGEYNAGDYKLNIQADGYVLDSIELDSETEAQVMKEAEEWVVEEFCRSSYYDDVHECGEESMSLENHPVESFGAPIIVMDGHFFGISLWVEQTGGNGWSGTNSGRHCLLLVDGSIHGSNEKYYSFSGEDSSKSNSSTYKLIRKTEAAEPYVKEWYT